MALAVIDFVCSLIWYIFIGLNKIVFYSAYFIIFIFTLFWVTICTLGPVGRFFKKTGESTKTVWKYSFAIIIDGIFNIYNKTLERISKSVNAKRVFAVFALLFTAYLVYPPTHWGPWVEYEKGVASWYGPDFYLKKKADGSRYYPWDVSAAHKELPLGEIVKVKNLDNGKTIYVKVDDRGPYIDGRIIDLSYLAALKLGMKKDGLANVIIYRNKSKIWNSKEEKQEN